MPRPAPALARATLVAAALLAAAPAAAQRAPAAAPRTTSSRTTSPRVTPPAASAAVPLPPPPVGTALLPAAPPRALRVGGLVGLSTPSGNGGDPSILLQLDAAIPWRTTAAGVALSWALPVRTVFLQSDDAIGLKSGGMSVEATPALRASVPLRAGSTLAFRTDVGVGAVARWTWAETDVTFVGRRTDTDQTVTGIVRVGFALDWAMKPGVVLAFEPLSFGYDLEGNADWNLAAGLSVRL